MALLGQAALAMWWDMAPDMRSEFEHWHTHEHFPERLSVPGFHRASRWRDAQGGEGFFVFYEITDHAVLSSPAYLARLNAPTPWSQKLMPHHRNMVRSQNRVIASRGLVTASHAMTLRFAVAEGREDGMRAALSEVFERVVMEAGIAGAHLLRHETPAIASPTTEQKIRGLKDQAADGVMVLVGYEAEALRALRRAELDDAALIAAGAQGPFLEGLYTLSCSATQKDIP